MMSGSMTDSYIKAHNPYKKKWYKQIKHSLYSISVKDEQVKFKFLEKRRLMKMVM